jgi:hypothetical protein
MTDEAMSPLRRRMIESLPREGGGHDDPQIRAEDPSMTMYPA